MGEETVTVPLEVSPRLHKAAYLEGQKAAQEAFVAMLKARADAAHNAARVIGSSGGGVSPSAVFTGIARELGDIIAQVEVVE